MTSSDPVLGLLPDTNVGHVDHIVGNQPDGKMVEVAEWLEPPQCGAHTSTLLILLVYIYTAVYTMVLIVLREF